MAPVFPWLGLFVCIAGLAAAWLVVYAASRTPVELSEEEQERLSRHCRDMRPRLTPVMVVSAVAGVLGLAATVPSRFPFSPGMKLGVGFVIGVVLGMVLVQSAEWVHLTIARWTLRQPENAKQGVILPAFAGGAGLCFLALAGIRLTMLLPAPKSQEEWAVPLLGYLIGLSVVCLVATLNGTGGHRAAVFATLLTTAAAVTTLLALRHRFADQSEVWPWLPMSLAAVAVLGGLLGVKVGLSMPFPLTPRSGWAFAAGGSVGLSLLTVLIMGVPLGQNTSVAKYGLMGILMGALVAGHLLTHWRRGYSQEGTIQATAFCILVVLTAVVLAFKLDAGLAVGLVTLFAWTVAVPCVGGLFAEQLPPYSGTPDAQGNWVGTGPADPATTKRGLPAPEMHRAAVVSHVALGLGAVLTVPVLFLLYRVYVDQFRGRLHDSGIAVHYTVVGMAVGAVLGVYLVSCLTEAAGKLGGICIRSGRDGTRITAPFHRKPVLRLAERALSLVLPMALAPAAVLFLWDAKACLGLIVGLWLVHLAWTAAQSGYGWSIWMPQWTWSPSDLSLPAVLTVLLAIPLTQFGVTQGGLGRPHKVWLSIALFAVLILWRIVADAIDHKRQRRGDV